MSILRAVSWIVVALSAIAISAAAATFLYVNPQIPAAETYRHLRLETPLRMYSRDGKLLAEFGERRLDPLALKDMPPLFIKAVLDTEDARFYRHGGIDLLSFLSVGREFLVSGGEDRRGASTITMQLARNISFSPERKALRKLKEIVLAMQIERQLSKDQILELYLNVVSFGKRAYGAQAAAYTYYGRPLAQLGLPEWAMLAGIPQRPSAANPVNAPSAARERRNHVLARMLELGSITQAQYQDAAAAPISAHVYAQTREVDAQYAAELARQELLPRFGKDLYSGGLIVRLTIDSRLQQAANAAVIKGIVGYDRRHGWRGAEAHLGRADGQPGSAEWREALLRLPAPGGLEPVAVVTTAERTFTVLRATGESLTLGPASYAWAAPRLSEDSVGPQPTRSTDVVNVGDVIRLRLDGNGQWEIAQIPDIQSALVALAPLDGAITAMVGGFDFNRTKFNHATQSGRQPGSGFKPFVYSAALDQGVTPATIFMDAPLVFDVPGMDNAYRPENFDGTFHGPTSLRKALYRSINLVSMRVVMRIGARFTRSFAGKFGFDITNFPPDLQLALGGGTIAVSPLAMARAYAVFANGGYLVTPHLIQDVRQSITNRVLYAPVYPVACPTCFDPPPSGAVLPHMLVAIDGARSAAAARPANLAPRAIDVRNAFIMNSMLGDVTIRGTAARASIDLGRRDLHGKTGTTNVADTWFNGYNQALVSTVWLGFSDNHAVGSRETGATAALPIWIDFMRTALAGVPEQEPTEPPGILHANGELFLVEHPLGAGEEGEGGDEDSSAGAAPADIF